MKTKIQLSSCCYTPVGIDPGEDIMYTGKMELGFAFASGNPHGLVEVFHSNTRHLTHKRA